MTQEALPHGSENLEAEPRIRREGVLRSLMGSVGISLSRFPAAFVLTATAALLLMLVDAGAPLGDLDPSLPDDVLRLGPQRVMSAVAHGFLAGFPTSVLVQLWGERHGKPLHGAVYQAAVGIIVAFAIIVAELKLGADSTLWMLLYAAAFCVPFFCGLYLLYTTENEATLLPVILSGLLFSSFLSGVLTVGLLVIVGAFEALVRELPVDLFDHIFILCWAFVFPVVFLSRVPLHDDDLSAPRAWRAIVGYVVFPLCLLLLAVLYLYLGRIALTRTMPSGEMNWYGSFALLVYLGLWTGMRMMDNAPARWFVHQGWALLVPVVIVQLYGVYVRLSAYGLTPLRYLSLACTFVGIVGLVLAAMGRGPRQLCLVAAVVAAVVLVSPGNALDMANLDQERCLRAAVERVAGGEEIPEGMRERVTGAWDYLRSSDRGYLMRESVSDGIETADDFERELGFAPVWASQEDFEEYRYVWASATTGALDTSGHSKMWVLQEICSYEVAENGSVTMTLSTGDGQDRAVDLTQLARQAMDGTLPGTALDDEKSTWDLPAGGIVIDLDDGARVVITGFGVQMESGRVTGVDVEGFLLD